MPESLIVTPTRSGRNVVLPDGKIVPPPAGWSCLPPGDAGLTRRVKAAGPSWQIQEMKGRKKFSRGLWAPTENIEKARADLKQERASPAYAKKRAADAQRREKKQDEYVGTFAMAVLQFLNFSKPYAAHALKLTDQVTAHATPVGSGTVARTKSIPVGKRAAAAVYAWMRHKTTHYDSMKIARVKGRRREVRHEIFEESKILLERHRSATVHPAEGCSLCRALGMRPAQHS